MGWGSAKLLRNFISAPRWGQQGYYIAGSREEGIGLRLHYVLIGSFLGNQTPNLDIWQMEYLHSYITLRTSVLVQIHDLIRDPSILVLSQVMLALENVLS